MKLSRGLVLPLSLTALLGLSACTSSAEPSAAEEGGQDETLNVLASFYPLEYVTGRVGGEHVDVQSLTPAGAEPHDLELSPATVDELGSADAVVYLSGFQPAVDEAVAQAEPEHAVDALHSGVEGMEAHSAEEHGAAEEDHDDASHAEDEHPEQAHAEDTHTEDAHEAEPHAEEPHAEEAHSGEAHAEESAEDGHEHGGQDPHFWLDPQRLAAVAVEVAHELGEADPDNAATYVDNAEQLAGELAALDEEFREGLATCERRTIVVSHDAYGYLAEKYDLEQVAVAGFEPDTEPSPARLAEVGEIVEAEGVTTVFSETLVNPKVTETLAAEHGVETAVLDPVEGLVDESKDYQQVMRENLQSLRTALDCA